MDEKQKLIDQHREKIAAMRRAINGAPNGRLTDQAFVEYRALEDDCDALAGRITNLTRQPWGARIDNSMSRVERLEAREAYGRQSTGCPGLEDTPRGGSAQSEARIIRPGEPRGYNAMFGAGSNDGWRGGFTEFVQAVASGRAHPQLRGLSEGVGADGGFLVPAEYAGELFNLALEGEIVRPRATIFPMKSRELKIPATTIGDHSSNLFGGTVAYWGSEGGTLSESAPAFKELELKAGKLSIFTKSTTEWREDGINADQVLRTIFSSAIGWYLDVAFLSGNGAGRPLGILNAGCTIEVPAEDSQAGASIVYANLTKMLAALAPASFKNSVWLANPSTIPQLLSLVIVSGAGGTVLPVLKESNGSFSILTRPVVFTEKLPALGAKGDLALVDLSQYAVGIRGDLRLENSNGPYFTTDQIAWRCIARVDGQPLWSEPLTLADGVTEVSPFVVLAERA